MKKPLLILLLLITFCGGELEEAVPIIEVTTTTTLAPTTTTTTNTVPIKEKKLYDLPELINVSTVKIDDNKFRVDFYFEYDDYNQNSSTGYKDILENLTNCTVTIYTGQNLEDQGKLSTIKYIWNNEYAGGCISNLIGSQLVVSKEIDLLVYEFNWNSVPNNQIAIQSIYLIPVSGVNFTANWILAYGSYCESWGTCQKAVDSMRANYSPHFYANESGGYIWNGDKEGHYITFNVSNNCIENINENGTQWWAIFSSTPCYSR